MENSLNQQYLEAMGIQQWIPRNDSAPEIISSSESVDESISDTVIEQIIESAPVSQPQEPIESTLKAGSTDQTISAFNDIDNLDQLRQLISNCTKCQIAQQRNNTVFGAGNPNAELMLIGEAPGADEDKQGEPFVGRAGKLLDKMLEAIGLQRNQIFIANILKCRPPNNRDPQKDEVENCIGYLNKQIELIEPKVILSLGRVSAQNLLESNTPISRLRGQPHDYGEQRIPLVATYHPAYLLRSPSEKAKAWDDLKFVQFLLSQSE